MQRLDPSKVREILQILRVQFPGWNGFDHPAFLRDEIEYKQATVLKARKDLARQDLRRLLDEGRYDEILHRFDKIGKSNNLLYRSTPSQGDLNILYHPKLDPSGFCTALFDLLHGKGDSPERLGRYIYWVKKSGLPSKWTFPTYFLFVCHPETEIFIKPETTKAFLDLLGIDDEIRGEVTPAKYDHVRKIAHGLMDALADYQPRDMVDIQSIFWVCGRSVLKRLVEEDRRIEFQSLFDDFITTYPLTPAGRKHIELYTRTREQAEASFESIRTAAARGEDITNQVLLLLLPYADSKGNRERGAWIHYAPAVTKDLRSWFEGARWAKSEDWPRVSDLEVRAQENVPIARKLDFTIDLVLYHKSSQEALAVIDTKYKAPRTPASDDVQQAIAYAKAKGCRDAVLIYPAPLEQPLQAQVGEIRIRSLAFDLRQDLEEAGTSFLSELLDHLSP